MIHFLSQEFKKYCQQLESRELPVSVMEAPATRSILPSDGRALLVYTDIPQVEEFLTRPEFILSK